ncbi:MAG: ATP-binding protein [Methanobrevibacter sp.]|jgi:type II secretory pathway predicted ATPase ExeA|nr:ATP-binding protein [Methanobrevibacter sp.]
MLNLPLGIPKDINKYFFNRKKELSQLNNLLVGLHDNVANQLLVTGYRGVGKSFLLRKLLNSYSNNVLTAYVDISKIFAIEKGKISEETVLKKMLNEMNNALPNKGKLNKIKIIISKLLNKLKNKDYDFKEAGTFLSIPIPDAKDNYQKLAEFVMEFPQKIVDSYDEIDGFIIVIDEFQLLGELKSPKSFFWLIRSFTQEQDNVSYIFTGSTSTTSDMISKLNGVDGAFGMRMLQLNLNPFTESETKNYLNERIPEIKFSKDGFKRFYKCTRGFPAYINSFLNVMSKDVNYDEKMIIETFFFKLDQIAIKWITAWSTLNLQEKEVVTIVIDNESISWKDLLNKVSYSQGTLNKILKKLKNKGLIDHFNAKYTVQDYMLKAWLEHRKSEDDYYPI